MGFGFICDDSKDSFLFGFDGFSVAESTTVITGTNSPSEDPQDWLFSGKPGDSQLCLDLSLNPKLQIPSGECLLLIFAIQTTSRTYPIFQET